VITDGSAFGVDWTRKALEEAIELFTDKHVAPIIAEAIRDEIKAQLDERKRK